MSIMVIAVSRCMNARVFGNSTTITLLIWPLPCLKYLRARTSTPCGVVRSPMPIITAPLPITRMSPPSTVAGSWCSSSLP